jgi:CheY-like chemotaxis protein
VQKNKKLSLANCLIINVIKDQNLQTASLLTVLIAEDDPDDQELLKEAILEVDPAVRIFSFFTGKKFLHELESMDLVPAMIILDYNIPEMNGAELLQYLNGKEQYRSMIKIVWSTSDSPFYINACLASGANAYFVKPSTLSGLADLAKRMLSYIGK